MTWNLWWRFGDWQRRLAAVRETLRAEDPDVCGVQEVWDTGEHNAAALLAEALGMHGTWVR